VKFEVPKMDDFAPVTEHQLPPATPDWVQIRTEHASGEGTLQDICDRHAIPMWKLLKRLQKENWTRRRRLHTNRGNLLAKLYDLIDLKIIELTENPTGNIETEARLLASLTQSLNKLIELDNAERKAKAENGAPQREDYRHLRERLARRIQRIVAERDGGVS
jgi:hypothetical protein